MQRERAYALMISSNSNDPSIAQQNKQSDRNKRLETLNNQNNNLNEWHNYFEERRHLLFGNADLRGKVTRTLAQSVPNQIRPLSQTLSLFNNKNNYNKINQSILRHNCYNQPRFLEWEEWRIKDRLKTVSCLLVVCLNIGVDPPDSYQTNSGGVGNKPQPCARLECWVDPFLLPPQKSLELIGKSLQNQFEQWQPRARFKQALDPTAEELKKLLIALRRNAKDERVLFYYNGHGVPRPTVSGEIWVFNKTFTQYLPISLHDIQSWVTTPALHVYDCSSAGHLVAAYLKFANQRDAAALAGSNGHSSNTAFLSKDSTQNGNISNAADPNQPLPKFSDAILLAACRADESLPLHPDLPADLFTSCLTTPIEMALRWFVIHNEKLLPAGINYTSLIKRIPGKFLDRRTPLGELNWIFTSITDTIAFTSFPPELFKKIFRQDLMVAALFRNFLLADRIMRHYGCHPMSYPELPTATHQHRLWEAWDLAAEQCLLQLPTILDDNEEVLVDPMTLALSEENSSSQQPQHQQPSSSNKPQSAGKSASRRETPPQDVDLSKYQPSTFFAEQLTALELWLERAGGHEMYVNDSRIPPPEQLPIVLQVLLSQHHRLRALVLLGRFLDIGPWAVRHALSVGIFPYILKLLQSPSQDLRLVLVFIWARIVAVDGSCRLDLLKENGYQYFVNVLANPASSVAGPAASSQQQPSTNANDIGSVSEQRAMAIFILSVFINDFPQAQLAAQSNGSLLQLLNNYLSDEDPLLRQWCCICLAHLWKDQNEIKMESVKLGVVDRLVKMLSDHVPEVRAAILLAFSSFFTSGDRTTIDANGFTIDQIICLNMLGLVVDASALVRHELVITLSRFVMINHEMFAEAAHDYFEDEKRSSNLSRVDRVEYNAMMIAKGASKDYLFHSTIWKILLSLSMDPISQIAKSACVIVDWVNEIMVKKFNVILRRKAPPPSAVKRSSTLPSFHRFSRLSIYSSNESLNNATGAQSPANSLKRSDSGLSIRSEKDELKMPLVSSLFDWSSDFFRTPRLKTKSQLEVQPEHQERLKRRMRCNRIHAETYPVPKTFESQLSFFNVSSQSVSALLMHPFEDDLLVVDDDSMISVWKGVQSSQHPMQKTRYRNKNLVGTRVTSVVFTSPVDSDQLIVGSDDGMVRVLRNYADGDEVLSAWRCIPEMLPDESGSGLILDWDPSHSILAASGDVKFIKIWDVETEQCIQDLWTKSNSSVTCLRCDTSSNGRLLLAGCSDGVVRLYDRRLPQRDSLVTTWNEHPDWIVGLHSDSSEYFQTISSHGDLRFWDRRKSESINMVELDPARQVSSISFHKSLPLVSIGSMAQTVRVLRMEENMASVQSISMIRNREGFLSTRISPVTTLAFHPLRPLLATGGSDQFVTIYGTSDS